MPFSFIVIIIICTYRGNSQLNAISNVSVNGNHTQRVRERGGGAKGERERATLAHIHRYEHTKCMIFDSKFEINPVSLGNGCVGHTSYLVHYSCSSLVSVCRHECELIKYNNKIELLSEGLCQLRTYTLSGPYIAYRAKVA